MPVMPDHRLFDRTLGGGALLDVGIYPVQLCSLVLGTPDRVAASGRIGVTGVDEVVGAVLHHREGDLGVVKAAIRANLANTARITGSSGWIELPAFMHCPDHLVVGTAAGSERIDASFEGAGFRFAIEEVHRCLAEGRPESALMPVDESLAIATTLDAVAAEVHPLESAGAQAHSDRTGGG